jgi:tetratricopeptide (TPR) repeat protein
LTWTRITDQDEAADLLPAALVQFSKWIDSHERTDVRMPNALNSRCWTRALLGQDLDAALSDCTAAVKRQSSNAAFLDSRGLVYLRLGKYDKSIADYDAALAIDAKTSSARYCRGIARIRQGHAAEGQADIAEATAQSPKVAEFYSHHGITP